MVKQLRGIWLQLLRRFVDMVTVVEQVCRRMVTVVEQVCRHGYSCGAGWDDRALRQLVEAYLNSPMEREGVDMKPFLDKDAPYVKDISQEERRVWLHDQFRYLSSNRPRHRLDPEIYDWEYIYKV
ncbi:structural constituent of ribosome, partial [Homalodisca vitripennis]